MMKRAFYILFFLLSIPLLFLYAFLKWQGSSSVDWNKTGFKTHWDAQGIPTLEASDWESLVEAQGFVTASERLWQMELLKRRASGRLAEWFGEKAVAFDRPKKQEDWQGVAEKAYALLPPTQKKFCEAYAKGVNRFIEQYPQRWGAEYLWLWNRPEKWHCEDSLLVVILMAEELTSRYEKDLADTAWNQVLPSDWKNFLYPQLGTPKTKVLSSGPNEVLELPKNRLPLLPISGAEWIATQEGEWTAGSNAWAYREGENRFLANDPHLGASVPQLWYAIRLRISEKEWVVGVSIPGLPGVVIGQNSFFAWTMTNFFEDVDDALEEDEKSVTEKEISISVRKEKEPRKEKAYWVEDRPARLVNGRWYSRQWLALHPEKIRLPSVNLNGTKDWQGFNKALDDMKIPAQAILYMDKEGGMGLRVSGTGIQRRVSGMQAQKSRVGKWLGFESVSERPRVFYPKEKGPKELVTANQKLLNTQWGGYWSAYWRSERIKEFLSTTPDIEEAQMVKLQMDTQSRYLKNVLDWILKQSGEKDFPATTLDRWKAWNGDGDSDPQTYGEAILLTRKISGILLERTKRHFFKNLDEAPNYFAMQSSHALDAALEKGIEVFGIDSRELIQRLALFIKEMPSDFSYAQANRWQSQHPMAMVAPWPISAIHKVSENPQMGWSNVVKVEKAKFGASCRLVWSLNDPRRGLWSFPVGQSGHVLSRHYHDLHRGWFAAKYYPVLTQEHVWQ